MRLVVPHNISFELFWFHHCPKSEYTSKELDLATSLWPWIFVEVFFYLFSKVSTLVYYHKYRAFIWIQFVITLMSFIFSLECFIKFQNCFFFLFWQILLLRNDQFFYILGRIIDSILTCFLFSYINHIAWEYFILSHNLSSPLVKIVRIIL